MKGASVPVREPEHDGAEVAGSLETGQLPVDLAGIVPVPLSIRSRIGHNEGWCPFLCLEDLQDRSLPVGGSLDRSSCKNHSEGVIVRNLFQRLVFSDEWHLLVIAGVKLIV